uniref:FLYWCH-type domain-containing protein n=1 Tax=Meloidogyne hapla TaxID=6305 RepID=A0A1I8BSV7_MELHA
MPKFGTTKQDKPMLIDGIFKFSLKYIKKDKTYSWACIFEPVTTVKCKCRAETNSMTDEDTPITIIGVHTCQEHIAALQLQEELNELKIKKKNEFVHVLNFDEEDEEEGNVVDLFDEEEDDDDDNDDEDVFNENILNFDEDEEEEDDDDGDDEIGEQNNELLELREKNIDLNGAKNRLEIQLKSKINQVKEKNNELLKLRENFDAKVKAEIELHLKNTEINEQKNENDKHVEIASKKITAFELKINAMEINKIEMNTLNEKLKTELQIKIDTIKLMELSHAEIVEKLRKELEDVKNENAKLDKNLNAANKTVEENNEEIRNLKEKVKNKEERAERLQQTIDNYIDNGPFAEWSANQRKNK